MHRVLDALDANARADVIESEKKTRGNRLQVRVAGIEVPVWSKSLNQVIGKQYKNISVQAVRSHSINV
jgi:hypothetical protein